MSVKVSIVVPSYNDGAILPLLLKSIKQQSFNNYEILIIDGGSTDNTQEVIEQYKNDIAYFVSEPDQGIFDAMNKGIAKANGEWLFFIGCDDRFYDNEVLTKVFDFEKNSKADVLYGKILNQKKNLIEGVAIHAHAELMTKSLWHQSIFYKQSIFKQTGGYKLKYKIAADVVFNLSTYTQFDFNWVFTDLVITSFSGEGISSEVLDKQYHNDQKSLYFKWFKTVPKKKIYDGLQHHMYHEVKQNNLVCAIGELFLIILHTGRINPYLKNFLYFTKNLYRK